MHSTKKITKEDTWRPAELRRHISEKVHEDGYTRRRDDSERKHRGGESTERRHRDPEESRRERDKLRERDGTKERKDGHTRDRYVEHRREGSQDQRGNRDVRDDRDRNKREVRDRRHDRESEKRRLVDDNEGNGDRAADKEQTRDRERHRDRHKDKEKERVRDRERDTEENRDKRRKERDKEKWREKRDKEHRSERRRHEESGQERRDETEKQHREQRDRRHRDNYQDRKKDRDLQERHGDRKHSEQKEEREHKEHRRHKEERERRHKERGHHDEKSAKTSGESVRQSRSDKDREEKDKHKERLKKEEADADRRYKERRHREEEEDVKRNLGDRTNWKKSSSDKSHRGDKEEETKVDNDEDLAEQEYEDDFEKLDYEEDFEEMDESADDGKDEKDSDVEDEKEELSAQQRKEIEAIRRAMAEENERAGTARSRQSTNREEEDKWSKDSEKNPIKSSQRGKFINFVAAKQREVNEKVATKQKKRSTELLRLIDLDFSMAFSLLDLPPVNEYEMYIRSFGNTNTKQAYVQCNEDNSDREIQTEETEMCEKWTQHPPELSGACGDPNFSQEAQYKTTSELSFDSQSLTSFLNSASQVVAVLLEEDEAERKSLRKLKTKAESLSFSDGSLQLNTNLPFLLGRHISLVHFSQVQRHTMLSVHLPTAKPSAARLDSSTVICIWNIWEPSRPQKILLYESEVQCCCFSPGKSTLVFAGSSVGSVLLWDLREQASNHYRLKIGEDEWTFRQPTFSTDAVMVSSGHFSPVTSVEVVPSTVAGVLSLEVPLLASEEESSGLSFQLASLDESGVLNFWVVLELPKGNEAGSPTDLGLRPGGKVKLLHSSSLLTADRASPKDAVKTRPLQTLLLKFLPTDSNHFFIGTNLGLVSHGTSHGLKAPPKFYRFQEVDERPVDIVSIHFSPFRPHLFLVGCGDGSIRLHEFSRDQPVAEWRNSTAGQQVVSLQWAQTRPTVFCVLDAASNLHIWDLLKDNAQPVLTERMNTDRVTAMSVFGDSGQQSTYSGVALAHELGKIELHYFTRSFTQSSSAEEEKLESLMTDPF